MAKKRYRRVKAKAGELKAAFGLSEPDDRPDIVYAWGAGGASKADGHLLSMAFEEARLIDGKTLRQVLEERGYDIGTLQFSVMQKDTPAATA